MRLKSGSSSTSVYFAMEDDCSETGKVDYQLKQESCTRPRKRDRKEIYCPLTWIVCRVNLKPPSLLAKVNHKLHLKDISPWQKYCYQILLFCMCIKRKEDPVAIHKSCVEILLQNINVNFFKDIFEGLEHVLLSCEMHLYIEEENNEAARRVFSRIKSFHDLNQVCQAAVLAVKACILLLFGKEAQQEALKCITTAIKLDPDEYGIRKGAWYYLSAVIRAEIRKNQGCKMMPSLEERQLLERSIEKDPFLIHYVFLADTYREMAIKLLPCLPDSNIEESVKMSEKAKNIYEDVINNETATASLLNRCGMAMIELQKKFPSIKHNGNAFEKVLKIDPNNKDALIGMGHEMHWCMNDCKKALKYFERASLLHPVGKNIIQMKSIIDENYNPLEDCEKYMESEKKMSLGTEESTVYYQVVKAEYFLVKNKDIMKAARCWEKAVTYSLSAKELWEYQCLFLQDKQSKFSELLLDEIKLALEERMNPEDVEYLQNVLYYLIQE